MNGDLILLSHSLKVNHLLGQDLSFRGSGKPWFDYILIRAQPIGDEREDRPAQEKLMGPKQEGSS